MAAVQRYRAAARPSPETMEAYAQRMARYLNLFTEDSHFMCQDPVARDSVMTAYGERPEFQLKDYADHALVPMGEDPDVFLTKMDEQIDRISKRSPLTMEDHVHRAHCAFSAQFVFNEYKSRLAFTHFRGVHRKIWQRVDVLHNGYAADFYRAHGVPVRPANKPAATIGLPTPLPSRHPSSSTTRLDASQVDALLKNPGNLFNSEFQYAIEDGSCTWELVSFTQNKSGVEFFIQFTDQGDRIPMDMDAMRSLLAESALVTV